MTTLERIPAKDAAAAVAKINGRGKYQRRNKYNACKTIVGGLVFHSKREAEAWVHLKALERAGEIRNLKRQVVYDLHACGNDGDRVCVTRYVADFVYFDVQRGREIVADSKGCVTALFKIKAKMLRANYGIEVELM